MAKDKESILLASDHAGFKLKEYFRGRMEQDQITYDDKGVFNAGPSDYPAVISRAARIISQEPERRGVFFCGSGVGASITANRFKRVRAVLAYNKKAVRMSREHNDSNVIAFGARLINFRKAYNLFKIWLSTGFSSEKRHLKRVKMMDAGRP